MSSKGIRSTGSYIPRLRLTREAIATANMWLNPSISARAKGCRAICSHDEDSITLAVSAARKSLITDPSIQIDNLFFASTTLPFADRQNSVLICEALGLEKTLQSCDVTGSQRAGTTALLNAFAHNNNSLVVAADNRVARPGSIQEMHYGAAASALVTGSEDLIAEFIGSHSVALDFIDHYRSTDMTLDYNLEERWVKTEGYLKIIPDTIKTLLKKYALTPDSIDHLVIAGPDARTANAIAKACKIPNTSVTDDLAQNCGNAGTAHPLLMLCHALENAEPNQLVLMVGFGQGCDSLLFRTTGTITSLSLAKPLQKEIACGRTDNNYLRYLSFNGLVDMDLGIRAERDNRIAPSAFNRHRKTITGFIGGRCLDCDTPQFPRRPNCVNPECRSSTGQADEHFKDKSSQVKSFTEDWLALSSNPPLMFGNVAFEDGGTVTMEFTDFEPGELDVGTPLSMQFRIKVKDQKRGYKSYFWKAAPLE